MVAATLIISWVVFAAISALVVLCSFAFVRWYTDTYEAAHFLTITTALNVALSFILLMLIPVDVLNVSLDIVQLGVAIQSVYYVLFLAIDFSFFLVVPFCYFFFEESGEESRGKRALHALKYTVAFLVVFIVLIILGFILKGFSVELGPYGQKLLNSLNSFEGAIDFIIACTALLGLIVFFTYTAFGFSWLGLSYIKKPSIVRVEQDLEREISIAREQRRSLNNKKFHGRSSKRGRDEEQVGLLQRKERILRQRQEQLGAIGSSLRKCMAVTRPISIVIGIVLLAIALFIVLSILLSIIDKLNPTAFAYIINSPLIVNPLDAVLSLCIPLFPLDYVLFILLVMFLWFATLSAITRLGVRFAWIEIFSVQRRRTAPQGLLLCSGLLMLVCVTLAFSVDTIVPKYVTFGDQKYLVNETTFVPCSFSAPASANCTVSQIARIVDEVKFRFGFFADVFYWSNWVFIGFCLLGLIFAICLKTKGQEEVFDDETLDV